MVLKNYLPNTNKDNANRGTIYGIGTDLVSIPRIAKLWNNYNLKFAKKILSSAELQRLIVTKYPVRFLAKKFAAKEAVVKALGTGFNFDVYITNITITNNDNGQPQIEYSGVTKDFINNHIGNINTYLSISDEKNLALAFVVITLETCVK